MKIKMRVLVTRHARKSSCVRLLGLNQEIAQKFKRIAALVRNLQIAQLREQLSNLNM